MVKKRKEMSSSSPVEVSSSFVIPQRFWARKARFNIYNDFRVIDVVVEALKNVGDLDRFRCSSFGQFLHLEHRFNLFSAQLVHFLICREIKGERDDEMVILLDDTKLRFSEMEFALVTGLKFGELSENFEQGEDFDGVDDSLHHRCFSGNHVTLDKMTKLLKKGEFKQNGDAFKIALVATAAMLIGIDRGKKVPLWIVRLVNNVDRFNRFPWGRYIYSRTINSLRRGAQKLVENPNSSEVRCNVGGFPWALQFWAMEAICTLENVIGVKKGSNNSPRFRNWSFFLNHPIRRQIIEKLFPTMMPLKSRLEPTGEEIGLPYLEGIDVDLSLGYQWVPQHLKRKSRESTSRPNKAPRRQLENEEVDMSADHEHTAGDIEVVADREKTSWDFEVEKMAKLFAYLSCSTTFEREEYNEWKEKGNQLRNVGITVADVAFFCEFEDGTQLDNNHLDAYINMLRKEQKINPAQFQPNIEVEDTNFFASIETTWSKAKQYQPPFDVIFFQAEAEFLLCKNRIDPSLHYWWEADVLLIPAKVRGTPYLLKVDWDTCTLTVYDSFVDEVHLNGITEQIDDLCKLLPILMDRNDGKKGKDRKKKTLAVQRERFAVGDVQQQCDNNKCAVFMLGTIESLLKNKDIQFDISDEVTSQLRRDMTLKLFYYSIPN